MRTYLFILLTALITSCAQPQKQVSTTAILVTDATIVDVSNGTTIEKQQIVIDSGKIKRVTSSIENPEGYTTKINAKGKYIIPGLTEMHAHIPQPSTSKERIEEVLFLYLSNG